MTTGLPQAQVTATDLNLAMVHVGARRVPAATWRQADAMQLPFRDASVDLVACQFGVMFFPDRPAAYAEVARVPHGYHDPDRVAADLATAGLGGVDVETVELTCVGRSAADLARGYCRGTPLRAEIEARGDLEAATHAVATALDREFGSGQVIGRMAALVVHADTGLSPSRG